MYHRYTISGTCVCSCDYSDAVLVCVASITFRAFAGGCGPLMALCLCAMSGAGPAGVNDIKNHPFFATINFDWLYRRLVVPPFKPVVSCVDDAFHFDSEFTSRTPRGKGIAH